MPMRYANEADVLTQLGMTRLDAGYARLVRVENGLCDTFDAKTGRSFGVAPRPETRTVDSHAYRTYRDQTVYPASLVLSTPVRSVTNVTMDGVDVDPDLYRLSHQVNDTYYGIELSRGVWSGVLSVTGIWADQPEFDVPDDVREALTRITVDKFRQSNTSPNGQNGPDGFTVRPYDPWSDETVKTALDRHQVARILV